MIFFQNDKNSEECDSNVDCKSFVAIDINERPNAHKCHLKGSVTYPPSQRAGTFVYYKLFEGMTYLLIQ